MLYFAYGVNLNLRGLQRRCPRAKALSVALLKGYRLVFRRYADIVADEKAEVHGALFELTPACVKALDDFEGAEYARRTVTVETAEGPKQAMAYMMINTAPIAPPALPYYSEIAQGYRDWKLDEGLLRKSRLAVLHEPRDKPLVKRPRLDAPPASILLGVVAVRRPPKP